MEFLKAMNPLIQLASGIGLVVMNFMAIWHFAKGYWNQAKAGPIFTKTIVYGALIGASSTIIALVVGTTITLMVPVKSLVDLIARELTEAFNSVK